MTRSTTDCIEWLDVEIRCRPSHAVLLNCMRAQLLAAQEMAKACQEVIRLSDRKTNEWDRAKAAIAAYHNAGGSQ